MFSVITYLMLFYNLSSNAFVVMTMQNKQLSTNSHNNFAKKIKSPQHIVDCTIC